MILSGMSIERERKKETFSSFYFTLTFGCSIFHKVLFIFCLLLSCMVEYLEEAKEKRKNERRTKELEMKFGNFSDGKGRVFLA